jgi:hypothetical protein
MKKVFGRPYLEISKYRNLGPSSSSSLGQRHCVFSAIQSCIYGPIGAGRPSAHLLDVQFAQLRPTSGLLSRSRLVTGLRSSPIPGASCSALRLYCRGPLASAAAPPPSYVAAHDPSHPVAVGEPTSSRFVHFDR